MAWALGVSAVAGGGLDALAPVGAYFNGTFPPQAPGEPTGWQAVNAFPHLTFVDPLRLLEVPGSGQLLVVGKDGRLWRFDNDPAVTQAEVVKVLDWRVETQTSGDQGFYSLVFHPAFGTAGENRVYACYSHRPSYLDLEDRSYWRLSCFEWNLTTGRIDAGSEEVLINQYDPQSFHNGGAMWFGEDGFLYLSTGDGGAKDDLLNTAQRMDQGLFGGVLRLDVENDPSRSHPVRRQPVDNPVWGKFSGPSWPASSTQGYGIPDDNPWQDPAGGVLEEFFAIGLRSPHAVHPDFVTGEIWVGDVGQAEREELTRIGWKSNAQWAYREGTLDGPKARPGVVEGFECEPDHEYSHQEGTVVIGGMRYRGAKWSTSLGGKVLFGDHFRGWVRTLEPGDSGGASQVEEIVTGLPTGLKAGLANFCTDAAGEVYLMILNGTNQAGGTILKLAPQGVLPEPPPMLSQTGVFQDLVSLTPAAGVIPYDVASPLWSDGATKRRWIILPHDGALDSPEEKIGFEEHGPWRFPEGTVFVKHFEIEVSPGLVKRLETRFLVCTEGGGKYGVTYRWNAAGTDAVLLTGGATESYTVELDGGGTELREWQYPGRADCLLCHNPAAGQALGFRTASLNRDFHYPSTGRIDHQIETLNDLGAFDRTLTAAEIADLIAARSLSDEEAPLEHRVRSYLDSNCAHCHRPGAAGSGFDARLGTPLAKQGMVGAEISGAYSLGPDGRYLRPGEPLLSAIHVRTAAAGNGDAMPPLAKNVVDHGAVEYLQRYILGLEAAAFATEPLPEARYVRLHALTSTADFAALAEFSVLGPSGAALPITGLSVAGVDSEETVTGFHPAAQVIDGDSGSYWRSAEGVALPQRLTLDLGSIREIGGHLCLPRQDDPNGRILDYRIEHSIDGVTWSPMDEGTWSGGADGERFDDPIGWRPARCEIAGPTGMEMAPFEVTVVFDMSVDDLTIGDFEVSGGAVTGLRGSGDYFVATVTPAARVVDVTVAADAVDPVGRGSRVSNTWTVVSPISFEDWAADHGVSDAPLGDEDGDGWATLLEFAFGLDPEASGVASVGAGGVHGLPVAAVEDRAGERLRLTYLRRRDVPSLSYQCEFGGDPGLLGPVEAAEEVERLDSVWERVTVDDPVAVSEATHRFGRVRVTLDVP